MHHQRRAALLGSLALVGLLQSGCAVMQQFTTATLSTDGLAASIEEVVGIPVTVTCPDDIPLEVGRVTECTVSDGTIAKVLVVTQIDDQGNVDWEISELDAPGGQG